MVKNGRPATTPELLSWELNRRGRTRATWDNSVSGSCRQVLPSKWGNCLITVPGMLSPATASFTLLSAPSTPLPVWERPQPIRGRWARPHDSRGTKGFHNSQWAIQLAFMSRTKYHQARGMHLFHCLGPTLSSAEREGKGRTERRE
jgi:hypothetical protein